MPNVRSFFGPCSIGEAQVYFVSQQSADVLDQVDCIAGFILWIPVAGRWIVAGYIFRIAVAGLALFFFLFTNVNFFFCSAISSFFFSKPITPIISLKEIASPFSYDTSNKVLVCKVDNYCL
jgi:hypothetical protein